MSAKGVPVLFLVFNRPAQTARVFESIRAHKPAKLFVAADGARDNKAGEAEIVRATREIATKVDWPCEVKTLFRDRNLGCGPAVSGAISWFFDHVEEGIILEDDCLPHPDFFQVCATLLERYRDDPRVATISGTHFLPDLVPHRQSHYASKYFQMWGWATWRRTWKSYDFTLNSLSDDEWWTQLQKTHPNPTEAAYWREIYRALKAGGIDTWDFQVFFSCWRHGSVHIMPGRNLIANIGYGPDATHTNFASPMANLPVYPLTIGPEPIPLEPSQDVDNLIFYLRFLESLTHTWWVEQVFSPGEKLGHARTEIIRKDRQIRQLETEIKEKRRQLLAATRELALQATSSASIN
ncbi:hemolytic protein HlpA-like protein [Nibricoccus aquaticus]|uniref:Hemolytic protein HlpA-like protein n=1 Tax=Nibricoccus aquaticus TaxID=2576891 RepID=A0A290Q7W5_9BACT|nr:hemolytic protein HlpA-like protein [Nibricoccus aquaticus]ATC64739.1 hemolytic protein HlpA-like protein [Nibricoccus aquaticus]